MGDVVSQLGRRPKVEINRKRSALRRVWGIQLLTIIPLGQVTAEAIHGAWYDQSAPRLSGLPCGFVPRVVPVPLFPPSANKLYDSYEGRHHAPHLEAVNSTIQVLGGPYRDLGRHEYRGENDCMANAYPTWLFVLESVVSILSMAATRCKTTVMPRRQG